MNVNTFRIIFNLESAFFFFGSIRHIPSAAGGGCPSPSGGATTTGHATPGQAARNTPPQATNAAPLAFNHG